MKKTILLLIIAQLSFAFIPGGNFKIILNSKIHIVHDTVGIWSGIENSYRLSDKGIKYVSDFKDSLSNPSDSFKSFLVKHFASLDGVVPFLANLNKQIFIKRKNGVYEFLSNSNIGLIELKNELDNQTISKLLFSIDSITKVNEIDADFVRGSNYSLISVNSCNDFKEFFALRSIGYNEKINMCGRTMRNKYNNRCSIFRKYLEGPSQLSENDKPEYGENCESILNSTCKIFEEDKMQVRITNDTITATYLYTNKSGTCWGEEQWEILQLRVLNRKSIESVLIRLGCMYLECLCGGVGIPVESYELQIK